MRTFHIKSNAAYGKQGPAASIEARTPHAAAARFSAQCAPCGTPGAIQWEQPREDADGRLFSHWSLSIIYPADAPDGAPHRVFISEQIGG